MAITLPDIGDVATQHTVAAQRTELMTNFEAIRKSLVLLADAAGTGGVSPADVTIATSAFNGLLDALTSPGTRTLQQMFDAIDDLGADDIPRTATAAFPATNVGEALRDLRAAIVLLQTSMTGMGNQLTSLDAEHVSTAETGGVTTTNVQLALEQLHTEVDALSSLTPEQVAILADVAAAPVYAYADVTGALIASTGATGANPTPGTFAALPLSRALPTARYVIQLPDGGASNPATLADTFLVFYNASGDVVGSNDVSGYTAGPRVAGTSAQFYTPTVETIAVTGAASTRLQVRSIASYSTFTLSSKFRVPLGDVTGLDASTLTLNASEPSGSISANNVQAALVELESDIPSDASDVEVTRSATRGLAATNVQAALVEHQGDINGINTELTALEATVNALDVPANARELTSTTHGSLTSTNVQAALEELQDEISGIDTSGMSGTGLTQRQLRTLANVAEGTGVAYGANVANAFYAAAASAPPHGPTGQSRAFPGDSTFLPGRYVIEVPPGTSLTGVYIIAENSAGEVLFAEDVSGYTAVSTPSVNADGYLSPGTINIPTSGVASVRLVNSTVTYLTYTLSNKYRVPSTGITGLNAGAVPSTAAGGLTSTTVQAALEELDRDITGLDVPADASELDLNTNAARGGISATNVQAALVELDGDITGLDIPADASDLGLSTTAARGGISATDVQAALVEVKGDIPADASHVGLSTTANRAGITATNVQAALVELDQDIAGLDIPDDATDVPLSTTAPRGGISATNVQAALVELKGDIGNASAATTATDVSTTPITGVTGNNVQLALQSIQGNIPDDATDIAMSTSAARGGISATNVQAALVELEGDITGLDIPSDAADLAMSTTAARGGISATNVQAALVELEGDIPSDAAALSMSTTAARGGISATNVQAALVELEGDITGLDIPGDATDLALSTTAARGGIGATNVQAALVELDSDITGLVIPTTAADITNVPKAALSARTVQAALDELQAEITTVVNAGGQVTAAANVTVAPITDFAARDVQAALAELHGDIDGARLTGRQTRTLAEVAEGTSFSYAATAGARIALVGLGNVPGVFRPVLQGTTPETLSRLFVEIPATTTVTELYLVRRNNTTQEVIGTPIAITSETREPTANAGFVRYRTLEDFDLATGVSIRVETRSPVYDTYTLSDKYRVPFSTVTGAVPFTRVSGATAATLPVSAAGNLTSTNVQAALVELQGDIDGKVGVTPRQTRTLAQIEEGDPTYSYSDLPGAQWAFSVPNGTAPTGSFANFPIPQILLVNGLIYSVPAGTPKDTIFRRRFNGAGEVQESQSLGAFTRLASSTSARDYYFLPGYSFSSLGPNDNARLQTRAISGYQHYTLSNEYRVPASTITGLTAAGVTSTAVGNLAATNVQAALQELQEHIDAGGAGLTPRQTRTLAEIAEGGSLYAWTGTSNVRWGRANAAGDNISGGVNLFPALEANTDDLIFVFVAGTDVSNIYRNRYSVDSVLQSSRGLAGLTRLTNSLPGTDFYYMQGDPAAAVTSSDFIVLQNRGARTGFGPYTLSSKFRIPAEGIVGLSAATITNTATGNLTSTNVQAALQELQGDIDTMTSQGTGGVTARQVRTLAEIDEGSSFEYTHFTSARLATASGTPPSPGTFAANLDGRIYTGRVYIELPRGTDIGDLRLRGFNTALGRNVIDQPLTRTTVELNPTIGMDRYLTVSSVTINTNYEDVRVERRSTIYSSYTLSDKYRLPNTQRISLNTLTKTAFDLGTDHFRAHTNIARTMVNADIAEVRYSAALTDSLTGTTEVGGGAVPIIDGADTYILVRETMEILSVTTNTAGQPVVAVPFESLGRTVRLYRAYRLRTAGLPDGTTMRVRGGTPTGVQVTFDDAVKVRLRNMAEEVSTQLIKAGRGSFFDHVQLRGNLTNTTNQTAFHYLPKAMLATGPKRSLSDWTAITNGAVPQTRAAAPSKHVILLPEGIYPNKITWRKDASQPVPGPADPSATAVNRAGFTEIDATQVPPGYEGFEYISPAWNAASALNSGTLNIGTLADVDISRFDFDPTVKITDDNLDLSTTALGLTTQQTAKLDALQLKTFTQRRTTEGKPNEHYELLLASAWPDPEIDYVTATGTVLGQRSELTGVRERNSGQAEFYNLVSNGSITLGAANPATAGVNYLGQLEVVSDYAGCAAVRGGTIQASDSDPSPMLRIDDDQGVFATMTLHVNQALPPGNYEVMNIGNATANSANGLVFRKVTTGRYDLFVREFTTAATTTTRTRDVMQQLRAPSGRATQIYDIPANASQTAVTRSWAIPTAFNSTSHTFRLRLRVWNNNVDLGVHDFTDAIPNVFQTQANFDTSIGRTAFTINLETAGFTGLGTINAAMSYSPPSSGTNNQRRIFLELGLTRGPVDFEATMFVLGRETVTVTAGATRDRAIELDINTTFHPDGTQTYDTTSRNFELGFYVRSQQQLGGSARTLRYQVSHDDVVTLPQDSGETAPAGAVPVTFGNSHPSLAVNRFAIFKPRAAGFDGQTMSDLTRRTLRNRPTVGGLTRQAGGTYQEVFSPAYKVATYSISEQLNLPSGTAAFPKWDTDSEEPPELSHTPETTTFTANTNFAGLVTLSTSVEVEFTSAVASLASRSMILMDGTLQEQLPGGTAWNDVAGPRLYEEILQGNLRPTNRPEIAGGNSHPRVRRGYNTMVQFKQGARYRFDITGHRLTSGGATWPTTTNLVRLNSGQTFLQIAILPMV